MKCCYLILLIPSFNPTHRNGHKYTHESKKPHACHFCDKSYSDARSLRRHYENAHPEEYGRWLVLSQATNGDTSAIAVAAAAALFSSGLDTDSADQAAKELHVGPSTSAVLSSVLNGPVRGVLASSLGRSATSWSISGDALKAARSESASPASSTAFNEHHVCSPATSPTGQVDSMERMDDDESNDTRPVMTLTAENMAAAAKVALIMAHPLEAPKRVACAVCQKRFKNQSALNGHMRLHGGYGPAGISTSGATHTPSTATGTQSRSGRSHPSDDCHYTTPMDLGEKAAAGCKRDSQNLFNPTFQLSDLSEHSHSPTTTHLDESSQTLFDFISMRPNHDDSVWRTAAPLPQGDLSNFQHERNSSRPPAKEPITGGNNTPWLQYNTELSRHSSSHPLNSDRGDLRRSEAYPTVPEVNLSSQDTVKSAKQTSYSNLSHHIPRSASATAVSSMNSYCSHPKPVESENSRSAGMNTGEDWQKPEHTQPNTLQPISATSTSLDKNVFDPSTAIAWWSDSQQQTVTTADRRSENVSWSNLILKTDPPVANVLTQISGSKLPQFLDLDTKTLSNRPLQTGDSRGLFDFKSTPPPTQATTTSSRRRCNAPLNLDLSALSQPDRPHIGSHLGMISDQHLSSICCASGQAPPTSSDSSFRPQVGFPLSQHVNSHPSCILPSGLGNQYSPVTPAPGSASLVLDQKMEQPMAFTFPPAEPFQSTNSNGNTTPSSTYPADPHTVSGKTTAYCTSPPARLASLHENAILSSKVLMPGDRVALRHSASSDKIAPFITRWHSGPPDSNKCVPTHESDTDYVHLGLNQQREQRKRLQHQQQQQTSHLYLQGRQHIQQMTTGCNVFTATHTDHPGHSVYRLSGSWCDHNVSTGTHTMETSSGSTTTSGQRSNVLSLPVSTNRLCANPNDQKVYCSRQHCPSSQTTGSTDTTDRVELAQPYAPDFNPIPIAHRQAFISEAKLSVRARTYQSATESSFADTLLHPFSNMSHPTSHRSSHIAIEEPERTRHTSAPFLHPTDNSDSTHGHDQFSCFKAGNTVTLQGYSNTSQNVTFYHPADPRSRSPNPISGLDRRSDIEMSAIATSKHMSVEFTSDTVADLLMQSHITDPFTIPEKLARCSTNSVPRLTDSFTNPVSLTEVPRSQSSLAARTDCDAHAMEAVTRPHGHSPALSEPFTGITLPPALPPTTKPLTSDTTNGTAGSSSADESDQSAVTRLSKSLVEDTLFRNPHTLPPPKKLKRKPAPIFIPPQTGANLSRLRSPRVWGSDGSALSTSPLPYTPPPMLSPNRRGSGLFSSLTRWPSTASPVVANRRYSSYYPCMSSSCVQPTGDVLKRKFAHLPALPFDSGETDGGLLLKRSYTGRLVESGNSEISGNFSPSVNAEGMSATSTGVGIAPHAHSVMQDGPRQYALPKRRCQLTPKSAPVLLQETSVYMLQTSDQNTDMTKPAPQELPASSTSTVFGYDDETMRRIAEADAADRARRLCRQRRRCDTEHIPLQSGASSSPSVHHAVQVQVVADPNLMQVDEKVDDLMNYKPHEELEIVEDTLAVLDEEMQDQPTYDVADDEDENGDEEEGLPSSLIPRINIGEAFQAEIPEFSAESAVCAPAEMEKREILMWNPGFIDEDDPKNLESLNLLMKLSCSPAIRNCGLNIEYAFHLLCKYEGNVEKALHALLRDTLVVDDYVYAETALWTTEEITRFQYGLAMYGRDFHLVARALQASGMNKTVKACVEFYYVWKRMNTPADVKWYREKARRLRLTSRAEGPADDNPLTSFEVKDSDHPVPSKETNPNQLTTTSTYNLRRKTHSTMHTHSDRSTLLPTVPEQTVDSHRLQFDEISTLDTSCTFDFVSCPSSTVDAETVGLDGVVDDLVCSLTADPLTEPGSYPCRFCSRVFTKVKSRNAHMKSHNDRATGSPGSSSVSRSLPQTMC
ncbi:Zinc finger protein [Fasciola gigantica]|uniref:Zinc finger protein n=1 Tax=Fasciola gigantica TaxID=46835 RepID=A0A504YPW9_FASGI|nr:Zinc finger protein [Fasciola gigantica]